MPGPPSSSTARVRPETLGEIGRRVLRYVAGSGVATVCSQVTFVALYGALRTGPAVASTLGWAAGAIPSYWLNRSWTWQRRGRPSLTGEILPYVAIVVGTLVVATVATSTVHGLVDSSQLSDGARLVLVGATFLGVYAVMFLLRYLLLDRLFRRPVVAPPGNADPFPAQETA